MREDREREGAYLPMKESERTVGSKRQRRQERRAEGDEDRRRERHTQLSVREGQRKIRRRRKRVDGQERGGREGKPLARRTEEKSS